MKRSLTILLTIAFFFITERSNAQIPVAEIIKQAIKKVIKATDLMVQRLQNKTIVLQNAQRLIENEMSKLKLNEIKGWVDKQKQLYANYFDELWRVKNQIATYNKVRQIIQAQANILTEYHTNYNRANRDQHFTIKEVAYMQHVYTGILDESLKSLEQLYLVINGFKTQMNDGKRMEIINQAGLEMEAHLTALRRFNQQNIQVSIQRAAEKQDVDAVKKLYRLN